jgi:hypothetical protein
MLEQLEDRLVPSSFAVGGHVSSPTPRALPAVQSAGMQGPGQPLLSSVIVFCPDDVTHQTSGVVISI